LNFIEIPNRRATPLVYAQTHFEQQMALLFFAEAESFLKEIPSCARRFAFRVWFVPRICKGFVNHYYDAYGLCLGFFHCHTLASERMACEFLLIHRNRENLRKKPFLDWFLSVPSLLFWEKRYDAWLEYTQRSYNHFLFKSSYDIKYGDERSPKMAALIGVFTHFAKNKKFFGEMVSPDAQQFSIFEKNAKSPRKRRWNGRTLDTWLLEIWPIVQCYHWNYSDLQKTFNFKVEGAPAWADCPKYFEDRCKKILHLRLSERVKRGRPKEPIEFKGASFPKMPLLFPLCARILSIGEDLDAWFKNSPAALTK
jgi:hypothetical protein